MAPGDTAQGKRYPDVEDVFASHERMESGGYRRVNYGERGPQGWQWECVTPNGHAGNLAQHEIIEHEDGTITVSPSILVSLVGTDEGWHGYLERGVWREV